MNPDVKNPDPATEIPKEVVYKGKTTTTVIYDECTSNTVDKAH